jgi:hypothetical protein
MVRGHDTAERLAMQVLSNNNTKITELLS